MLGTISNYSLDSETLIATLRITAILSSSGTHYTSIATEMRPGNYHKQTNSRSLNNDNLE